MLNQQLFDTIKDIGDQALNGSLEFTVGDRSCRMYFDGGHLILLDFCTDKELLLAKTFLEYHKIDEAMFRLAVNVYENKQIRISDTLSKQQLVSDEEAAYVARSMVENTLVDSFWGSCSEINFYPEGDDNIGTYDLDVSAMKIRIETPMLLNMVQARVAQRTVVQQEFPDYKVIVGLTEKSPDEAQINDMENAVYMMVDGRKDLNAVAVAIRDRSINVAIYVKSLMEHGLVRRMDSSGEIQAKTVTAATVPTPASNLEAETVPMNMNASPSTTAEQQDTAAPSSHAVAEETVDDFQVYRNQINKQNSLGRIVILLVILIVVGGIGYLVVNQMEQRRLFEEVKGSIDTAVVNENWESVSEIFASRLVEFKESNNIKMMKELQGLKANAAAVLKSRLDAINNYIADQEWELSEQGLNKIPESFDDGNVFWALNAKQVRDTHERYDIEYEEFQLEIQGLRESATLLLKTNRISEAIQIAENEDHPMARDQVMEAVEVWRDEQIGTARDTNLSLFQRLQLLDSASQAKPSELEKSEIQAMRIDIETELDNFSKQVKVAQQNAELGQWQSALDLTEALQSAVLGSEVDKELDTLKTTAMAVRNELTQGHEQLVNRLSTSADPKMLEKSVKNYGELLDKRPQAVNIKSDRILLAFAERILESVQKSTTEKELFHLANMEFEDGLPDELEAIRQERLGRLEAVLKESQDALNRARELVRLKLGPEAVDAYTSLLSNPDWSRTKSQGLAQREIAEAHKVVEERKSGFEEMYAAMKDGDAQKVMQISESLNIKQLPLYIKSNPEGAEIKLNGKVIGKTPFLLEALEVSERAEAEIILSLKGYESVTRSPLDARAGWLLDEQFVRKVALDKDLENLITSGASTWGNKIVLAGSQDIFITDLQGNVETKWVKTDKGEKAAAVSNPIYSQGVSFGDDLYFSSRDNKVVQVTANGVSFINVDGASDEPCIIHGSQVVVNRRVLILKDLNGSLSGFDDQTGEKLWQFDASSSIAGDAKLINGVIYIAERNGQLSMVDPDDGSVLLTEKLSEEVKDVWVEAGKLHGFTTTGAFSWDGNAPSYQELSVPGLTGQSEVYISVENRLMALRDGTYQEIQRVNPQLRGDILIWGQHYVLTYPKKVVVIGPQGFELESTGASEFVASTLVDGRLVCASSNGKILVYNP